MNIFSKKKKEEFKYGWITKEEFYNGGLNSNPGVEEAIDLIISMLSEEQIQHLNIEFRGEIISFKNQMLAKYGDHHPIKFSSKSHLSDCIKQSIEEFKPFFETATRFKMNLFLNHFDNRIFERVN